MTLAEAVRVISAARTAEDLFGEDTNGDLSRHIEASYRGFAKVVHPDVVPTRQRKKANDAFVRLQALHQEAERKVGDGTYGKAPVVVLAGKAEYQLGNIAYEGDVADVYAGTTVKGNKPVLVKVAREPSDNDLMENEARVLTHLDKKAKKLTYRLYLPELLETLTIRDGANNIRQANIFTAPEGFYTLEEVHEAYPEGVDPRDMAWMLNRILEVLGFVHAQGTVHGALNPKHCLIHPESHGLILVDWCFAGMVEDGSEARISAVVPEYERWYPPEVLTGNPATPGTDIYLAARLGIYLLGGNAEKGGVPSTAPWRLAQFLRGCLIDNPSYRPSDAWKLYDELAEVLRALFGPKQFHLFAMPKR